MGTTSKARPTEYRGVVYESKCEAMFARFLELHFSAILRRDPVDYTLIKTSQDADWLRGYEDAIRSTRFDVEAS